MLRGGSLSFRVGVRGCSFPGPAGRATFVAAPPVLLPAGVAILSSPVGRSISAVSRAADAAVVVAMQIIGIIQGGVAGEAGRRDVRLRFDERDAGVFEIAAGLQDARIVTNGVVKALAYVPGAPAHGHHLVTGGFHVAVGG